MHFCLADGAKYWRVCVYIGQHVYFQAPLFLAIPFWVTAFAFHHIRKQRNRGGIEGIKLLKTDLFFPADRQEGADMEIASLLARYPENIDKWPQESIFKIIEEIHSEEFNRHYSIALFNKRGSSVRCAFDGGDIEREHANYFRKLANDYRAKYPTVSEIFSNLSDEYLKHAKQIDQQAELEGLEY